MEEGTKTEKKGCSSVTIVCIVLIVILDIFAGFFGLRAEAAQQDVKHKRVWLLKTSLVPKNKITTKVNVACLFLIWPVGLVGAAALGMGIWTNRESRSKCGFTNKDVLSFGSKVCFLHAIVSVVYYVSFIVAKKCWSL